MGNITVTSLACLIAIPKVFLAEVGELYWQSFTRDLYNDVPTNREIVMVTATEVELQAVLSEYPQVKVCTKHNQDGTHAGQKKVVTIVDDEVVVTIEGTPNYTPDVSLLSGGLKPHPVFDVEGVQVGSVPRVLSDDDVLRLAGWAKRIY